MQLCTYLPILLPFAPGIDDIQCDIHHINESVVAKDGRFDSPEIQNDFTSMLHLQETTYDSLDGLFRHAS